MWLEQLQLSDGLGPSRQIQVTHCKYYQIRHLNADWESFQHPGQAIGSSSKPYVLLEPNFRSVTNVYMRSRINFSKSGSAEISSGETEEKSSYRVGYLCENLRSSEAN